MKRLISTTASLALMLGSVPPFPLFAQTAESCIQGTEASCAEKTDKQKKKEKRAADKAAAAGTDDAAAAQAAADKAAAKAVAAEQAAADKAAAKAAAEDQAAADKAAAKAAAAEQAAADDAAAKAVANEQAAADAAAKAAADQAAAAEAALKKAAADQAAAEAAAANQAAADQAAAEAAATDQAAADKAAAADQAAADKAAEEAAAQAIAAQQTAAEKAAAEQAAKDATVADQPAADTPAVVVPAPDATVTVAPETAAPVTKADKKAAKEAAKAAAAAAEPVVIPEAAPEAVQTLETLLAPEEATTAAAPPVAALLGASNRKDRKAKKDKAASADTATAQPDPTPVAQPAPITTTERTIVEGDRRSSDQEFSEAGKRDKDGKRKKDSGLSDLEKVGLVALGALAVGVILNNGNRVVSNSGDRVVVARSDGGYDVLKDDDALLYQPGADVRTESFRDGSTRTTVLRTDGSRIVTIRDASGRVLQRVRYDRAGRETYLIDDLDQVQPIDVTTLPRPPKPVTISASGSNAELGMALANANIAATGRAFSLRQVREVREVRALAPQIEVEPIQFRTGSSAIDATEAQKLADLGGFISRRVAAEPDELFLIEGHTDAVGSAPSNLALSDRRAESLALALTEYFDVPPENLVVQGYGEGDLLIPSEGDEPRNRRVAVRIITSLLTGADS